MNAKRTKAGMARKLDQLEEQPPWFNDFLDHSLNRAIANHYAGRGRYHAKMNPYWNAGASAGLGLCNIYGTRKIYAEDLRAFNEQQWWLFNEIGAVAWMRKADAVAFLSGLLSELNRRVPLRGNYTDVILRVLGGKEVWACPTMRHIADLVKRQLPPEVVKRMTKKQHVEFYNSVRMFCKRMGVTPSKRGRPKK
jgi:hypothetical protein